MLRFEPVKESDVIEVSFRHLVWDDDMWDHVGELLIIDDEYQIEFAEEVCGPWDAAELRQIADKLDELNTPTQ